MQNTLELEKTTNHREIVSFRVAQQDYCIDIGHVREIRGWSETTRLPHTPDFVKGVMNLRGNVIPVIDLSHRLGLGRTEPSERHVIVITAWGDSTVGLLVDAVSDIMSVTTEQMRPTPEVASSTAREFIEGVFAIDETLIRAVDLQRILPQDAGAE